MRLSEWPRLFESFLFLVHDCRTCCISLNVLSRVRGTYAVNGFGIGEGSRPHQVISACRVMDEFRDPWHKHWNIPPTPSPTPRPPPAAGPATLLSGTHRRTVIIVPRSGYHTSGGRSPYRTDIKMFYFHATKDAGYCKQITFLV